MSSFTTAQLCSLLDVPFSDRQLQAITAPLEPSVIMAGAGSGKTAVMTARVVWLVATGVVQPEQVLGLTFTNKAAGELRSRVRSALSRLDLASGQADAATVSTYHAFAQQLLIDEGLRIGLESDLQVLTDVRRSQLAMRVVRHPESRIDALSHSTTSIVSLLIALDGRLAEEAVELDAVRTHDADLIERLGAQPQQANGQRVLDTARRRLELLALVEQFRAAKMREQAIDYADMVRLALRLVRERSEVAARLRGQYRIVLLDEYQDTSVAQRLLMQQAFGDGHAVTAVGDALQAIYEWRGASAVNIIEFPQHFPCIRGGVATPAPVYGLPVTQRFGSHLAALANDITADLRADMPDVEPLEAADDARTGAGIIEVALHPDAASEFAWIAEQLLTAHAEVPWGEMAVLVREHRHEAALFEALSNAGIPAQIAGKQGLLKIPDVADVVAYLRVLHDPAANTAWVRILSGMRYRVGLRDLALLGARARSIAGSRGAADHWEAALAEAARGADPVDVVALGDAVADPGAALSAQARQRIAQLDTEVRSLRRLAGQPIADIVHAVVQRIGLDVEVAATERAVARGRMAALEAFLELVRAFTSLEQSQSLSAFLRWLDDGERLQQQAQVEYPVMHDAVLIMTVHAAKGLERPVIALPALVEGSFPSARGESAWTTNADALPYLVLHTSVPAELLAYPGDVPRDKEAKAFAEALRPRKLAEETRLAYVAVTRARQRLIASAARTYGSRVCEPSRYLEHIRDAALRTNGRVHCWVDAPAGAEDEDVVSAPWPVELDADYAARLQRGVRLVEAHAAAGFGLTASADPMVQEWDSAIEQAHADRLAQRGGHHAVPVPVALTTTEGQALIADPDRFLLDVVRPMPKAPARSAKRGSTFHAWVERQYGQQLLFTADDGFDGVDEVEAADLLALQKTFLASEWARRTPLALEVPFSLALGDHWLRGRIDAVYRDDDALLVIDWKTNARQSADPIQLAVYRRAAAAIFATPIERVRAGFFYVVTGTTVWHDEEPDVGALLSTAVG